MIKLLVKIIVIFRLHLITVEIKRIFDKLYEVISLKLFAYSCNCCLKKTEMTLLANWASKMTEKGYAGILILGTCYSVSLRVEKIYFLKCYRQSQMLFLLVSLINFHFIVRLYNCVVALIGQFKWGWIRLVMIELIVDV